MCKQVAISDEEKYENKKKFCTLLTQLNIDISKIIELLDSIGFFDAPFNGQTCRAYSGGLCEFSIKYFNEMFALANAYFADKYNIEDIIKVALFKNIYRAVMYEPCIKNVKNNETGQWESVNSYKVREDRKVFGDIGFSSYMMIRNLIELTDEQIEAICNSDANNSYADIHEIKRQYPLVSIALMAGTAVGYLLD